MTMGNHASQSVFLIHGGGDCRVSWSNVAPRLVENGYYVIVPELRGHGRSSVPENDEMRYKISDYANDIVALTKALKIESADYVGHSCGSLAMQLVAINLPEMTKSITLIASGAHIRGFEGRDMTEEDLNEEFYSFWAKCGIDDGDFKAAVYEYVKSLPLKNWRYIFRGIDESDTRGRLDRIKCPVQMFWGDNDDYFTLQDEIELMSGMTNTSYVVPPSAEPLAQPVLGQL